LLVVLFVMMMAFANFDEAGFTKFVESMRSAMGGSRWALQVVGPESAPFPGATGAPEPSVIGEFGSDVGKVPGEEDVAGKRGDEDVAGKLRDEIVSQGLPEGVTVREVKGRVNLEINESVLFPVAVATLSHRGQALLQALSPIFLKGDFDITVEGHTDSVPISTPQFPSNWELSSARASSVVRYLIEMGVSATRLKALGLADTRPIGDNGTAEGRARNRRVNLILEVGKEAG
jgi:chemotaxis protein MotB